MHFNCNGLGFGFREAKENKMLCHNLFKARHWREKESRGRFSAQSFGYTLGHLHNGENIYKWFIYTYQESSFFMKFGRFSKVQGINKYTCVQKITFRQGWKKIIICWGVLKRLLVEYQ